MPRILLIDDDPLIYKYLAMLLEAHRYTVRAVQEAHQALAVATEFQPDVTILDLTMPSRDGLDLLPELKALCPASEVIIYTGTGDVEKAVLAMKRGAYDFIQKPLNYDAVALSIERALDLRRLREENTFLRQAYDAHLGPGAFLAFSETTRALLGLADRYGARPGVAVLIEGESGTGKELIARHIHGDSSRPFVAINCGAIPRELVESELFGYAPGAFTGARAEGSPGKIQTAEDGTLFLDEIADLEANSQVKLLRFLEHGTFYPVGATKERRVQVRVVCATNRRLDEAVANREFRRDLYYRINVGHIRIPALRERPEEILPLAYHFLRQLSERYHNPFETIAPAAQDILRRAPWKGNVRELRNTIERVVLIERGPAILPEHLAFLEGEPHPGAPAPQPRPPHPAEAPLPEGQLDLEAVMLRLIERALEKHDNNQSRAARYLCISRETLRYRVGKAKAPSHPEPHAEPPSRG
jgi:DNA-binding NtrC family response regulator